MKKMKRDWPWLLAILFAALLFTSFMTMCADSAEPLRITISDPLPPTIYPAKVCSMTDAEFFEWATDQNNKTRPLTIINPFCRPIGE